MIAYIVGRGPSLLSLLPRDFGPGPVFALNSAILEVRKLNLPNPILYIWKDGCLPHGVSDNVPAGPGHDCPTPNPLPYEMFITSLAEGPYCHFGHPLRRVVDVEQLGVPWYTMSSPVAVLLALEMGAEQIVMLAHDAYTDDDTRRVMPNGVLEDDPHAGYYMAGHQANEIAKERGVPIRWVVSKVPA